MPRVSLVLNIPTTPPVCVKGATQRIVGLVSPSTFGPQRDLAHDETHSLRFCPARLLQLSGMPLAHPISTTTTNNYGDEMLVVTFMWGAVR